MDPNAALENILRGHMIEEHAEALTLWLQQGGFAPDDTNVPNESAFFVTRHCDRHYPLVRRNTIRVRADKTGLWTAPPEGPWICLEIWFELCLDTTARAKWEANRVVTLFLEARPELKR